MTNNRRAGWIGLAAAAVLTMACGLGSNGGTTPTPSATSTLAPTTAAPTSAAPTSAAPLILTTPQAAAEHLYDAWKNNDKPTALLAASTAAVDTLFAKTWESGKYFFGGCTTPTAPSECDYNHATGIIAMHIVGNATTGFRVNSVTFGNAG